MTSAVIFYQLKAPRDSGKVGLICKLVETAFKRKHKVYVATKNERQSAELDRALWTYSWSSFIPHAIQNGDPRQPEDYPVIIGHAEPASKMNDVLLSTLDQAPQYATQFDRIVDPVDASREDMELAIARQRQYLELTGIEPITHQI